MRYTLDIDAMKLPPCATRVRWRVSASGRGFHVEWTCRKKRCHLCAAHERQFDDATRYALDKVFPQRGRILWDRKGRKKAGPWKNVTF